jgi:hypothetical protein
MGSFKRVEGDPLLAWRENRLFHHLAHHIAEYDYNSTLLIYHQGTLGMIYGPFLIAFVAFRDVANSSARKIPCKIKGNLPGTVNEDGKS